MADARPRLANVCDTPPQAGRAALGMKSRPERGESGARSPRPTPASPNAGRPLAQCVRFNLNGWAAARRRRGAAGTTGVQTGGQCFGVRAHAALRPAPSPEPSSDPAAGRSGLVPSGAGDLRAPSPRRRRARLVSRVGGRAAVGEGMSECEPGTPSFEMTWSSTTSSGYCSQEDSDSELEQYFTARTSFIRKPHKDKDEQIDWEKPVLTQAEIEQKIKEYNSQINSNLFMSLNKDGSYTGFIKVQLKLIRPVSVPASKKAPSIQDVNKAPRSQVVTRRTSFYLPKDTVKHLHIISRTRASEVIEALLKKFMVVDNPRKFALFERAEKDDQVYLRKLSDEEQPLHLRLLAGPNEKVLSFVLKENETGEVNWDAFSMPELHNFLRILQREEEEHVRQILHKYARCRQKMQEALTTRTPG
ncbi:GATOR complex protein NPRL2 isoform X3 [Gopherus flavomarginatus]|nr:GATOR complex protein NPRL2 isoform X3 [Gopherus flavomarginatus]